MYRIKIDRNLCIGCLTCVAACVVSHESDSGDSRNRVVIDSETKPAPIFCRHCDRPECVYTCMTGAMKKILPQVMWTMIRNSVQAVICVLCPVLTEY